VAVHLQRLLREDQLGGSLALGELIDQHGEEIYLDLKEFWDFDLVSFIAGEVYSSIPIILAMVRNLPEGSRYYAAVAADHLDELDAMTPARDPRVEAIMDRRIWTTDRQLSAAIINAINTNTAATGQWSEKPPEFPIVGPASWKKEDSQPAKDDGEYKDNFDFFRKKGFPIG
jgi:hypothetical protein